VEKIGKCLGVSWSCAGSPSFAVLNRDFDKWCFYNLSAVLHIHAWLFSHSMLQVVPSALIHSGMLIACLGFGHCFDQLYKVWWDGHVVLQPTGILSSAPY